MLEATFEAAVPIGRGDAPEPGAPSPLPRSDASFLYWQQLKTGQPLMELEKAEWQRVSAFLNRSETLLPSEGLPCPEGEVRAGVWQRCVSPCDEAHPCRTGHCEAWPSGSFCAIP